MTTGGFEKRPGTATLAEMAFLDNTLEYFVHPIDRSTTEQFFLMFANGDVAAVNAITGAQVTVNIEDTEHYFAADLTGIDSTGVVTYFDGSVLKQLSIDSTETAFAWEWELSDAATVFNIEGSADGTVWNTIHTGATGATGSTSTTIGAVVANDHNYIRINITTAAGTSSDTITLKATFKDKTYLLNADADDLRAATIADTTFVVNRNIFVRKAEAASGTLTGTRQEFSGLPGSPSTGDIYKITGKDTDNFSAYYVIRTSAGVWEEHVDPTISNKFQPQSMPHQIVREADGTFTFKAAPWEEREAGDADLNEDPEFVGKQIQDVTFFSNRLTFIADETVATSRTGDVYHLYAEKAIDVLDTDPIARAASSDNVNVLKFCTTFRKILFATATRAQFEMSADTAITPENAAFDLATSYVASPICKPVVMGDVLYFASANNRAGVVYEYFFEEVSLSNTAGDISKHVEGYIPKDIFQFAVDPTSLTMYCLSTGEQNSVFVYRTFFDGANKVQSAWQKYTFGASESDAFVHGMAVFDGYLVLVIERGDGNIYLEQMTVEREAQNATAGYTPLMDQREVLTGVYDSGNDHTTWTMTAEHNDDAAVVLGPSFSEPGRKLTVTYPTATTVRATGDHSANQCWVGRPYTMTVELSKIYMRETNDSAAILEGRLTLGFVTFQYVETGYFEVKVTVGGRDSKSKKFEGKTLGDPSLVVGSASIASQGQFQVRVNGESDVVKIEVINDEVVPCVITAASWTGFYNEKTRQG